MSRMEDDPSGTGNPDPNPSTNWWEGPRPANWPAHISWPPTLPPGAHYGTAFGSIIYPQGTPFDINNPGAPGPYVPPTPTAVDPHTPNPGPAPRPLAPMPPNYTPGQYPDVPGFHPPDYVKPPAFSFEDFKAPTAASMLDDPSYQFRRDQGAQALEQSAAARGTLNGGGTLKDLLNYGQNLASTEYNNIWNRDLGSYKTRYDTAADLYGRNVTSQYNTPYDYAYKSAMDQYAPQLKDYQNRFSAVQRDTEFAWQAKFDKWVQDFEQRYKTTTA